MLSPGNSRPAASEGPFAAPTHRQSAFGTPADARLLIVNADDFGMCHAINEAVLTAAAEGIVASTTVMAPCPWAEDAFRRLKAHPELPFGGYGASGEGRELGRQAIGSFTQTKTIQLQVGERTTRWVPAEHAGGRS